ncbi:hypothetical protein, partial [Nocardia jinanensis]|uniref:hypothetical protein n=1 Tax=Nocardia jinanensis TaxID=382504 RepID=UPI001E64A1BE
SPAGARISARSLTVSGIGGLSEQETREFTVELAEVLSDAAELDADLAVRETLAGWRAILLAVLLTLLQ